MGRRRKQLERIWERDGGLCGIHFGGCGEKVPIEEAEVGHIIPKVLQKAGEKDEYMPPAARRELRRKYGIKIEIDMNVQPMHRKCNEKMAAVFPPRKIVCNCKCCTWLYEAREGENKFKLIEGWMGNEIPDSLIKRDFRITRRIQLDDGSGREARVSRDLGNWTIIWGPEGRATEPGLTVAAKLKDGRTEASGKLGQIMLTMKDMVEQNERMRLAGKIPAEEEWAEVGETKGNSGELRKKKKASSEAEKAEADPMEIRRRRAEREKVGEWLSARGKTALIAWNLCAQDPRVVGITTELGMQAMLWQSMTEFYGMFLDTKGQDLRTEILEELETRSQNKKHRVYRITGEHRGPRKETGEYIAEQFRKYEVVWNRTVVRREGGRGWLGRPVNLLLPNDVEASEEGVVQLTTEGILGDAEREDFGIVVGYVFDWLCEKEELREDRLSEFPFEVTRAQYTPGKFGIRLQKRNQTE